MGPGVSFDEAITEIKTAIDLDAAAFYNQLIYTIVLTYARRYDEADQQLERLAAINPNGVVGIFWYVGGSEMQGNNSEAFERLMRFQTLAKTDKKPDSFIRLSSNIGLAGSLARACQMAL
jgi:tetratricopeptide (TPR) repeat protein